MKRLLTQGKISHREPLYLQVETALRNEIAGMSAGDRLPSERLLADRYGVSLITVREAIRILAAEGRLERKQGKGTFLSTPRDEGYIAITIDQDISNPHTSSIYLRIAQEVRRLLEGAELSSRLYIGRNSPIESKDNFLCPEFFQELEEGRIRGVIGVLLYGKAVWLDSLQAKGIAMVGLGEDKSCGVVEDKRGFMAAAVSELVQRGKRRIGLLTWRGFDNWQSHNADLFRSVLTEAGLPIVESWIKEDVHPTLTGAGWEAFRELWLSQSQRPDGLIVMDDFFLKGVLSAAGEIGVRIPEQIEIAVRLSHHTEFHATSPLLVWKTDPNAIAKSLVDATQRVLQGQTPVPMIKQLPIPRAPELDGPTIAALPDRDLSPAASLVPQETRHL